MIADSGRTLSSILECSGGNLPFEFIPRPSLPCSIVVVFILRI